MPRPLLLLAALLLTAQAPLPPPKTTGQQITLPAGPLAFSATVGAIPLPGQNGQPEADIVATAFTRDGADPATRPVTFAINGGPGAASAWLDLAAIGPWRIRVGSPLSPSAPPTLQDNAETWLPFTDLVFLDPVGTGWSRARSDDARKRLEGVDGDIASLSAAIRLWLEANHRLASPKLVVGESYGGFRGPLLARRLQSTEGVGLAGLVLVSPVLDFALLRDNGTDPLPFVLHLPGMVAAARQAPDRAAVADAEGYAATDYLVDLWRGEADAAATARVTARVQALLPGLDPALVARRAGRVDTDTFLRERDAAHGQVGSIYDPTITSTDPFPARAWSQVPDPILEPLRATLAQAADGLYSTRLQWRPEGVRYEVLSTQVLRAWDWGRDRTGQESLTALRRAVALDPTLQVMVAHGLYDLITPYFASQLLLNQLPLAQPPGRVALRTYQGGHMFYLRDASRAAFTADAAALVARVVGLQENAAR